MTVALIPYACGLGSAVTGCERGPEVARGGGLKERLAKDHIQAVWMEGLEPWTNSFVPPLGSASRNTILREHLQDLCENVANAAQSRMLPVSIGGDHSLAIGSIGGLAEGTGAHGRIGVVWMGAHLDAHTFETTQSRAVHGMSLAALLGRGNSDLVDIGGADAKLSPEHVCIIGARAYEEAEMDFLQRIGVRVVTMQDIRQHGMMRTINEALDIVTNGTDHHYISFDLDVMDPSIAPAVSVPEPDGFSREDIFKALDYMTQRVEFSGIDIAEFNPKFDKAGMTLELMGDILAILAKRHVGLHVV